MRKQNYSESEEEYSAEGEYLSEDESTAEGTYSDEDELSSIEDDAIVHDNDPDEEEAYEKMIDGKLIKKSDKDHKKGSDFVNNKMIFLTYGSRVQPTHLDKKLFVKFMRQKAREKNIKIEFIRLAHETSDKKNPYEHTHVLMCFNKPFRSTDPRVFDMILGEVRLHPNVQYVKVKQHFENCKNYIAKQDPDNADLKRKLEPHWFAVIKNCKSQSEAIEKCAKTPSYVGGVISAYKAVQSEKPNKPRSPLKVPDELYEWSHQLNYRMYRGEVACQNWKVDMTLPPKDRRNPYRRRVGVLYNPNGDGGKTWHAMSMMATYPKKFWGTQDVATMRDYSTQVAGAVSTGFLGHNIIFNISKDGGAPGQIAKDFWKVLESTRDGWVTSQKNFGKNEFFDNYNMFVFTNWMPNLDAMAQNRFEIYYLHDVDCNLIRLDEGKCREIYNSEQKSRVPLGDHVITKSYYHKDQSISSSEWKKPEIYEKIYPPTDEEIALQAAIKNTGAPEKKLRPAPVKVCNRSHELLPEIDQYSPKLVQNFCKQYLDVNGRVPDADQLKSLLWTNFGESMEKQSLTK